MTDLKVFRKKALKNKKGLEAFLDKLDERVPEDMPVLVAEEDAQVWKEVDCLSCSNCCRKMTPTWTAKDIRIISGHLEMSPAAFKKKWLIKDGETGEWTNQTTPCQFLDLQTNKCSVYEYRPFDCREFPHHHKQPFDLYNDTYRNNLPYCPATYQLVSRLKKRVEREYEWD